MSCDPRPPRMAARDAADIARDLLAHRAGYVPEWTAPADAGTALLHIVARQLDVQGEGLNAMPQRLQLEFLDALGASVLPAQSARAALVFKLMESAAGDAGVPAGTRAAAVLPPPAPSLESPATNTAAPAPEFFTEESITAMRGRLAAVYSIDPQADRYADHGGANGAQARAAFTLFDAMRPAPHRLYLGHGDLFKLGGSAQIDLTFDFAAPQSEGAQQTLRRPLLLDWEYLSANGWLPLILIDDRTERFTRDGRISLGKQYGPDGKEETIGGHASYWIRATVSSRIPSARIRTGADGKTVRPKDELFEVSVESSREMLPGDVVTVDGVTRAMVVGSTENSLLLDAEPSHLWPGEYFTLADALPPLRPEGADDLGTLPMVDVIRARVGFSKNDLPPDSTALDGFSIDAGKDFYPFGNQPERFAAFYVACKDAFTRKGARVTLHFRFAQLGKANGSLDMQVEYFNGTRWIALGPNEELDDQTAGLTQGAPGPQGLPESLLSFVAPQDWRESEVNGEKGHWLRLRLATGDYGQPLAISIEADPADATKYIVKSTQANLEPPIVAQLSIAYLYFTNPEPLDWCVTENDFALAERSEDARWPRSPFAPFMPVSDRAPALHLGFSAPPPAALVSLLAAVEAPARDADPQPLAWDYWGSRGWTELSVRDTTLGLAQTGLIQFVGPPDALPREGLGGSLYRIRARLKSGLASQDYRIGLAGVWLNAVWASQGQRIERDILGQSNGNPDQTFALPPARAPRNAAAASTTATAEDAVTAFERALDLPTNGVPVLAGEVLEVREWTGRGEDWQTVAAGVPAADLRFESDPQDTAVKTALWIRWHAVPHLYLSGPHDRHYVVERARGIFRFPGYRGFIPPAGCPIAISYVTGGGVEGNVPAGAIRELRSGVGYVESVSNPLPAGGGAAAEHLRQARQRSAQSIRHRDRAVSFEDYEWLARTASPEVARARALPLAGPDGNGSRGFVGVVLVPSSNEAAPQPSAMLCDTVRRYLATRMPAGVAGGLAVLAPTYVQIGVRAEILPRSADEAGRVEARVRERLLRFLHPLTGGRSQRGWEFGEAVYLSDLAALLETTPGVDAVRFLQLMVGAALYADRVPVGPDQLVAAGDSQLKLIVPSVPYALA
jgi:hypothetical protein